MMKKILLCIFVLIAVINPRTFAQEKEEDFLGKIKTAKNDSIKLIRIYQLMSAIYRTHPDSAIAWAREGLNIAKNKYGFVRADLLNVISLVYRNNGSLDSAVFYNMRSLKLKEEVRDTLGTSNGLNNLAQIYVRMHNYKKAEEYYFQALDLRLRKNDSIAIASSFNNIGVLFEEQKQYDKALDYYDRSLDIKRKLKNKRACAYTMCNIGVVYGRMKNYDKGIEVLKTSLLIFEQLKAEYDIITIKANLGDLCNKKENYKQALVYLKDIVEPAIKIGNSEVLSSIYSGLASSYEGINDNANSLKYFKLYKRYSDSIYSDKNMQMVGELEGKYHSERKDSEIKLLNKEKKIGEIELKQKRSQTIFFTAIAFIFLILLVVVFRSSMRRKKDNITLQNLNTEITKSHNEVEHQKHIVEEKQKEILDSINYAKRIQLTLLAHKEMLDENLNEHFVLFEPKDIVSGDFYWATKKDDLFFLAVCDSTGHGVPGAFMCLLNIGFLSEAINENHIHEPHKVLDYVRERLIRSISKDGQKDGFDGILACFNQKTGEISYAAANNAPVIVHNGEYLELPADRMPVGKGELTTSFKLHQVNYTKGDTLYLYTDGYADQFGGPKGKKFMYKKLNNLAAEISKLSIADQETKLQTEFHQWKGDLEQIDDVCVIGMKI